MEFEHIKESVEQLNEVLRANPNEGRGLDSVATATLDEGIRTRVEGPNDWSITTDQAEEIGGDLTAPSPGWYMRASLASCDLVGLRIRAARVGIDLTDVEVTVKSESDARGLFGVDDSVPARPSNVRLHFKLSASNAGPERLKELVEWTEAHSFVGQAIREPVPMERSVEIV